MMRRYVLQHHSIGTYGGMVAHGDWSEQFGTRTDVHLTTDHRRTARFDGA